MLLWLRMKIQEKSALRPVTLNSVASSRTCLKTLAREAAALRACPLLASDTELCYICFDQVCTIEVQDCGHQMCTHCKLALCPNKPNPRWSKTLKREAAVSRACPRPWAHSEDELVRFRSYSIYGELQHSLCRF